MGSKKGTGTTYEILTDDSLQIGVVHKDTARLTTTTLSPYLLHGVQGHARVCRMS